MQLDTLVYSGKKVRTVNKDGQVWWAITDVCKAIGHSNSRHARSLIDDESVQKVYINSLNGKRVEVLACNEPGLWQLLLRVNVPGAKPFQHWVTREVLPALRKNKTYTIPNQATPAPVPAHPAQALPGWAEQLMQAMGGAVVGLQQQQAQLATTVQALEAKVDQRQAVDANRVAQELHTLQAKDKKLQKAKQNALKKAIHSLADELVLVTGEKGRKVALIMETNKRIKGVVTATRGVIDWGREFYEEQDFALAYGILDRIALEFRLPERPKPISFLDFKELKEAQE